MAAEEEFTEAQLAALQALRDIESDELRLAVLAAFCAHCGKIEYETTLDGGFCQCWNDE